MDYFFANTYMRKVGPKGLGKAKPQIYSTFASVAMFWSLYRPGFSMSIKILLITKKWSWTLTKSGDFLLVLILYSLIILGYT